MYKKVNLKRGIGGKIYVNLCYSFKLVTSEVFLIF